MKRNILLCVAGTTPQIITESLYDLTIQQGVKIDEIRVITTLDGRDKIMTGIIKDWGGAPEESLLHAENGQFFKFLNHYPQVGAIEFNKEKIALLRTRDGKTLKDIRTIDENELAGDQICEIVREICKDENTRIFASAAGGRKTMSIYLTLAMSLFGRAEDTLWHVLVNSDFETNRHFFYPPPTPQMIDVFNPKTKETKQVSTETAEIYLARIPFIRLQGTQNRLNLPEGKRYGELVDEAEKFLHRAERKLPLEINLKTKNLVVDDVNLKISDYEILLYLLFTEKKFSNQGEEGFVQLNSLCRADFEKAFEKIMIARDDDETIGPGLVGTDWEFLLNLIKLVDSGNKGNNIDYEDFMNSVSRAIGRLNKKLKMIPDKYKISSIGAKRPKKYGLLIPKELIKIQ